MPLKGVFRPLNVKAMLAFSPRSRCRPAEVSPGNWVGLDCSAPTFVRLAVPLAKPRGFTEGWVGSAVPGTVDHRVDNSEGPVKSQGAVGTCTAMSLSTAMEHALRRHGVAEPVSGIHVWSLYAVPRMGTAGDSTVNKRVAADSVWPYDPAEACKMMREEFDSCGPAYGVQSNTGDMDPQIQAKRQSADGAGKYKLIAIEKLPNHDPDEIAALIAAGEDIWVAFNINTQAWKNSAMQNNVIPDYAQTSATGHAVVLAGYRNVGAIKQFLIHNSWGTDWGEGGYAWISGNMVRDQLRYGYRVRIENPAAPGQPTPGGGGGCPAGQQADTMTGQCTQACPQGQAPAYGFCVPAFPGSQPPGGQPAPGGGQQPGQGGCAQGQAPDVIDGQCRPMCAGGLPTMGGMCLPRIE